MEQRYSCITCKTHFELEKTEKPICPLCGEKYIVERCARDPVGGCHCALTIHAGRIAYCDICGAAICPQCGDHDVVQLSRVTGYLQAVEGWNGAKRQELKDRHRWELGSA
jgi:DNA-directed RNA polymerase subunit RPC12/RpoP